jgi:hypothetical protein
MEGRVFQQVGQGTPRSCRFGELIQVRSGRVLGQEGAHTFKVAEAGHVRVMLLVFHVRGRVLA